MDLARFKALSCYYLLSGRVGIHNPDRHCFGTIPMDRIYFPYAAAADILRVRERFPDNGKVARNTAYILGELAKYDDRYRNELLSALRDGRLTGNFTPEDLRADNWCWLGDDPQYQEILALESDSNIADHFPTAMDPLDESQWRRFSTK